MTASLLVFVPVALFALIAGFYFVGCTLDSGPYDNGDPPGPKLFTKYSDVDVLDDDSIVAYWPLSEDSVAATKPVASAIAVDTAGTKVGNPHNGNYTHQGNSPALFPCPGFQISPGIDSAAAPGSISLGVESLLPGDAKQPANDPNILTTGMQCDGAFVTVPLDSVVNPAAPFTVEFWARPEWSADVQAYRMAIDCRAVSPAFAGYSIGVNEGGNWEAEIAAAGAVQFVVVDGGSAALNTIAHVVLTCDGSNATLYINGVPSSAVTPLGGEFAANKQSPFVIGAGGPWLPARTQPTDNNFFPIFPFKGTIQDVAIYIDVLTDETILQHFNDGSGKTMETAG